MTLLKPTLAEPMHMSTRFEAAVDQQRCRAASAEKVELVIGADGTLSIRPLMSRLSFEELQDVIDQLRNDGLPAVSRIRFDFSKITELVGPWGLHFAILIRFANEIDIPVEVIGLHGQPAALAWLFRRSPQIRLLLQMPSKM